MIAKAALHGFAFYSCPFVSIRGLTLICVNLQLVLRSFPPANIFCPRLAEDDHLRSVFPVFVPLAPFRGYFFSSVLAFAPLPKSPLSWCPLWSFRIGRTGEPSNIAKC
jgi:hypothetical protein